MFSTILKHGVKGMKRGVRRAKPVVTPHPKFVVTFKHKDTGATVTNHAIDESEAKNHIFNALQAGHSEINVNHAPPPPKDDHAGLQQTHASLAADHQSKARALVVAGNTGAQFEAHRAAWAQHSVAADAHGKAHSLQEAGGSGYNKAQAVAHNDSSQAHDASAKAKAAPASTEGGADKGKPAHNYSEAGVKSIAKLTDQNDHGAAIIAGAKMLNRPDIEEGAKAIRAAHMKAGGLTGDLYAKRQEHYKSLMDHAKKVLTPEQHAKFHGAY